MALSKDIEPPAGMDSRRFEFGQITVDLKRIAGREAELYSLGGRRVLGYGETAELDALHHAKNEGLVDLFLANHALGLNSGLETVIEKGPDEKIHPFSRNRFRVYVPGMAPGMPDYFIRGGFTDLRREGVAEDSAEAELLIGEHSTELEAPDKYFRRTKKELLEAFLLQKAIAKGHPSDYSIEELDGIVFPLIERIVGLRINKLIPPHEALFRLVTNKQTGTVAEQVIIFSNGVREAVGIPGQRIGAILASRGIGYDRLANLS